MGGVIFNTTLTLFHLFRNNQHPEYENISSCYLPISSNGLKKSLRKTLHFVLLPTGLLKMTFCYHTA